MKIVLDAGAMGSRRAAHQYLKEQLSFPEYYGFNLDALHDCLEERTELEVSFVKIPEEETYFHKVLRVFRDVARHGDGLVIVEEE